MIRLSIEGRYKKLQRLRKGYDLGYHSPKLQLKKMKLEGAE